MIGCKFCGRQCKEHGIYTHETYCALNPNAKSRKGELNPHFGKKGSNSWGLAKKLGQEIKLSEKQMAYLGSDRHKAATKKANEVRWSKEGAVEEQRLKIYEAIKRSPESYAASNVCGRVKKYEYREFILTGTWELIVAKFLDLAEVRWTNKIEVPFPYEWQGRTRLYFPDFYLPDYGTYIEVKGYERDRDLKKWEVVPRLIVIKKRDIDLIQKGDYKAKW